MKAALLLHMEAKVNQNEFEVKTARRFGHLFTSIRPCFLNLSEYMNVMAKSFKCGICKQQKSDVVRYQCLTHRAICKDHLTFFGKCGECGRDIIRYEYNPRNSRWEKEKEKLS